MVVQRQQFLVGDAPGDDDIILAETKRCHLRHEQLERANLVDDKLVRIAHAARQARKRAQHSTEVFVVVAISRVKDKWAMYAEVRQVGGCQRFRRQLAEFIVGSGRNSHHPFGRQAEQSYRIGAGRIRICEQQVVLIECGKPARIPALVVRYRIEMLFREQPGNEIMHDGYLQACRELALGLGYDTAFAPSFERAGAQHRIGADGLIAGVDQRRGDFFPQ